MTTPDVATAGCSPGRPCSTDIDPATAAAVAKMLAILIRKECQAGRHEWEMTWPLDPCEYVCKHCGEVTRQ